MSASADNTKPAAGGGPESPTTARPLDLDDDDVQESGVLTVEDGAHHPSSTAATASASVSGEEPPPPPKPPRPVTEQQKNVQLLKEAFPSIDLAVIKAVLSAAGGKMDPAFNALLEMTDPDHAVAESAAEPPPPPPPRPSQRQLSQLEADEQYARQLAEQYEATAGEGYSPRTSSHGHGHSRQYYQGARSATSPVSGSGGGGIADWFSGAGGQQKRGEGLKPNEMYDNREHSFLDDDLPVIKENLRKGFIETQTKVNSWIAGLKKKLDEQFDDDDDDVQHGHGTGPGGRGGYGGARRSGEMGRRSGDYDRYDADPQVLSDDFAGMKFHPDGTPATGGRPLANPDLFKPPPPSTSPKPPDGRRVAFRDTEDTEDIYNASPRLPPKDTTVGGAGSQQQQAGKPSKWQPLSTVDPNPISESDPFSLGDSDEEGIGAAGGKKDTPVKMDDNERLKKAAAEAMAESLVDPPKGEPAAKK